MAGWGVPLVLHLCSSFHLASAGKWAVTGVERGGISCTPHCRAEGEVGLNSCKDGWMEYYNVDFLVTLECLSLKCHLHGAGQ